MVAGLYSSSNRNIMECIAGGAEMDYMTLKEASEKWGVSKETQMEFILK